MWRDSQVPPFSFCGVSVSVAVGKGVVFSTSVRRNKMTVTGELGKAGISSNEEFLVSQRKNLANRIAEIDQEIEANRARGQVFQRHTAPGGASVLSGPSCRVTKF